MTSKFNPLTDIVREVDGTQEMRIEEVKKDISSFGNKEIKYTGFYVCSWRDKNGNSIIKTIHEDKLVLVRKI